MPITTRGRITTAEVISARCMLSCIAGHPSCVLRAAHAAVNGATTNATKKPPGTKRMPRSNAVTAPAETSAAIVRSMIGLTVITLALIRSGALTARTDRTKAVGAGRMILRGIPRR